VIESIIERSGTPYFSFKDIDENKPTGSIRIRVETIHYFLKRYAEDMNRKGTARAAIDEQIAAYERQLRQQLLFDEELADLAARQRENGTNPRMLPMLPLGPGATQHSDMHA
jgi:hypothetical protein